jgi:two-component system, NarL family, nitrate/nitrite response regulator NarL
MMKMREKVISIVVADDHPAVLHGVTDVLRSNSDIAVVAACNDGASALKAIRQFRPTVAVLDIVMRDLSGIDVLRHLAEERSATKVVFLTASASDEQILTGVARGAKGIVFKDMALSQLIECVRTVATGDSWLPTDLIDAASQREAARQSVRQLLDHSLTCRERQIAVMVSEGLSNKEISRRLNLSEGTVKIHLHNTYKKMRVDNRTALTAMAIAHREQLILPANPVGGSETFDDEDYRSRSRAA